MMDAAPDVDLSVDVVVVGCGPVGATLGNLLGRAGLTTAIFEREAAVYPLPRAAHFDGEIMRVFQAIGLAESIQPCTAPIDGMDFINADGERLFGFVSPPGVGSMGWENDYMFYQPDLEDALRSGLDRHPDVSLHPGHEVQAMTDHGDHVTARVRNLASGEAVDVRAAYVIGTDGARSITRSTIGSELFDYGFEQPWLVVDTFLRRPVDLPTVAVQYCDPARPATFIPHGGTHRRWEIMAMPGDDLEAMESPDRVAEFLAPWVAPEDVDVIRAVVYSFHALVARRWRSGRVLIAGDSAHQMPPFLGQGMCAGIRDAANLTWKLARVLRCGAPDRLLDTYQSEREPHVRTIIEAAVAMGEVIQTTDPAVARARDDQFRASAHDSPPGEMLPAIGPGVVTAGGGVPLPQVDRSDRLLGTGFTLVTGSTTPPRCPRAIDLGIEAVTIPGLEPWLVEHDAEVALVRPDRYVFGTARVDGMGTLVDALRAHLV